MLVFEAEALVVALVEIGHIVDRRADDLAALLALAHVLETGAVGAVVEFRPLP